MDLRKALNAVSDVIVNRPPPLREFDQIYMKAADMLIQADHVCKWLDGRNVVFIGDGDALALSMVHLHRTGNIERGPKSVCVLDFDERVLNSVQRFAEKYEYTDFISTGHYNVADALPHELIGKFDGYYTNPPFGASNDGRSVLAFMRRGFEACGPDAYCCIAIADFEQLKWCDEVLAKAQYALLENKFVIAEMVPGLHHYHLDDEPELTSCSLVGRRHVADLGQVTSVALTEQERLNFYGKNSPLHVHYVRDCTNGGKLASIDHTNESFPPPAGDAS